jgi:hypothetical protein
LSLAEALGTVVFRDGYFLDHRAWPIEENIWQGDRA